MTQQYPNAYGHPETVLRLDHAANATTLHVENCPIGMAITGPVCQVKVGTTLYDVTDMGAYPFLDWVVVPGVDFTEDENYVTGTPVWVPITHLAIEDIRQRHYITTIDETASNPNSTPVSSINLNQLGVRNHGDLTGVDANQHHFRFHQHDNDNDGRNLYPDHLSVNKSFRVSVVILPQLTVDVNNWNPPDGANISTWLVDLNAARIITGIGISQQIGRFIRIFNTSAFNLTFSHNSGSSNFANRFLSVTNTNKVIGQNGMATILFDGSQWRLW